MASKAHFAYRLPAVSLILAAAVAGCDGDQGKADKAVDQQLLLASTKVDGKAPAVKAGATDFTQIGASADYSDYTKALEAAEHESAASGPEKIRAKVLLAHDQLRAALDKAHLAAETSAKIDRLSLQIQAQAREIEKNTRQAAGLGLQDPKGVSAKLKEASDSASGAGGKEAWVTTPSGVLPSQAAVDKQMSDLKSKIADMDGEIKSKTEQRTRLVADADKFSEQAESSKDKAIDLYTQGSDARKKAADLTVAIDQETVLLDRAKADLAVLQGQHDAAQTATAGYEQMSATVDQNWEGAKKLIEESKADSQKILGTDGDKPDPTAKNYGNGGDTISSKLAMIQDLIEQNKKTRSAAQADFNNAIGKYQEAFALATTTKKALTDQMSAPANTNKPDQDAWKAEQDALAPLTYMLAKAGATADMANFQARAVEEQLAIRHLKEMVDPIITDAGLTSPAALAAPDDAKLKDAQKAVVDSYTKAVEELQQVYQGQGPVSQKTAAQSMSMFADYSWYLFDLNSGAEDEKLTKAHLENAETAVKDLSQQNVYFTKLPPELADAAPAQAATPGAAPGATPAAGTPPVDASGPGFGGAGAALTAASMAGTYAVTAPDPYHGGKVTTTTMELTADGKFTTTAQVQDDPSAKPQIATGTFTIDGTNLVMKLATINGQPLPAGMPASAQTATSKIEKDGKQLDDPEGKGPPLMRTPAGGAGSSATGTGTPAADAGGPGFGGAGGAPTAASMVGSYSYKGPVPGHPGALLEVDLVLKADGTFDKQDGASKDGSKPTDMLDVAGTYTVEGTNVMAKTLTVDGKPPPPVPGADQPHAWKIGDGGKTVTDEDGNTLTKQ